MALPKNNPRKAIVVGLTRAFAARRLRFLMVVGSAGTGKSHTVRTVMDCRAANRWHAELARSLLE